MTIHRSRRLLATLAFAHVIGPAGCSPTDPGLRTPTSEGVRIVESTDIGPADPFEAVAHSLEGDLLRIEVRYSGGCEIHHFEGLVGSAIAESFPVQMWGRIAHDDGDDPCDGIVESTISLDLSPVRELYQSLYGGEAATIILHFSPIAEPLHYSF